MRVIGVDNPVICILKPLHLINELFSEWFWNIRLRRVHWFLQIALVLLQEC